MDKEKIPGSEKAKELWTKTKAAVGKVSKKVWIILAVAVAVLAAGVVIYLNTRPYSILITGATANEVATVTNWLEGRGVQDYKYRGSDTILVPDRQAVALKAALLSEMYSGGNYDYSGYFDNVSMLSTEAERTNAWWIAVQEKMEAVISQMDGVVSASVSITPGEDRIYVLDSGNVVEASASVIVWTRDGKVLKNEVAQAIRGYVSGGVQGLKIEAVSLYDSNGNPYNGVTTDSTADNKATLLKFQMEQEYANRIRTELMGLLVPMFGEDNVRVAVNTNVEISNTTVDENEPWIPDYIDEEHRGSGQGIIGTKAWEYTYYASDDTIAGGLVGADPNSDISTNVEREPGPDEVDGKVSGSGQNDYNNPTRVTHTVRSAGYVTDCHVSVSLNSNIPAVQAMNTQLMRELVANAAGITAVTTEDMTAEEYLASKITIYSGPFYRQNSDIPGGSWWPFPDIVPEWVVLVSAVGLVLLTILLTIILVVHGKRKKKKLAAQAAEAERAAMAASEEERRQAEAALAEAMGMPQTELVGADVMSLQTEKSMELRQDIRQFVEENPEVAAQLLKSWLRGGEEHG